jgi:hypothetical protein
MLIRLIKPHAVARYMTPCPATASRVLLYVQLQ